MSLLYILVPIVLRLSTVVQANVVSALHTVLLLTMQQGKCGVGCVSTSKCEIKRLQ
jgi:hypothetical protein